MLTQKQEKFVQELIKGKSQREAYKAAYNAENMLDRTIDQKASLLFKKEYIRARYDELMQGAISKTKDDAESMRAFIIDKYKKIASGEICEETVEYDPEGKVIKRRKTIRPNDVNNAIAKLAEYYGVAPEEQVKNEITIKMENIQEYAD